MKFKKYFNSLSEMFKEIDIFGFKNIEWTTS